MSQQTELLRELVGRFMIEEADHVAVRYLATWEGPGAGSAAMIAFYRFVNGRIAEDWGVSTRTPWRR